MLKRLGEVLLAEGQLADGPDLGILFWQALANFHRSLPKKTYRLQGLLDLAVQGAALEGNDLGGGVRVVGDGRAALLAEPAPHGVARVGGALPLLDGALHVELGLGDDADEGCCLIVS